MKWSQKPAAYSVHKLNCVEAHSNKFAGMPNSRGEQLLVCRLLAFVVMVLKAHFQTLFVAASCNKITCSGVFVNIMYCRLDSFCMHVCVFSPRRAWTTNAVVGPQRQGLMFLGLTQHKALL